MRASDYLQKGTKNLVEQQPEGYQQLSKVKSGCHIVEAYIKMQGDRLEDIKFKVTKRCKKLLAIADLVADKIKQTGSLNFDQKEVLEFFKEEKETDKMIDRINLVKSAISET